MREIINFKDGPIEKFSWGSFTILGKQHTKLANGTIIGVGKDICLIGKDISMWAERKGHLLTETMLTRVFNRNIDILIIGNGVLGALKVPESLKSKIAAKGIKEMIILKTPEACRLYNEMFNQGKKVALLAHGTC